MTTNDKQGNWWTRPCGGRELLALALPLVISTMSYTVMQFCDRIFLSWYSTAAMAAVLPAGALQWTVIALPLGAASYANTFVAHYHGARQPQRIGAVIWHAMRIGLYAMPVFVALIPLSPYIFRAFGHAPGLVVLEAVYFRAMAFGAGGSVLSAALSTFFIGRGKSGVVMAVDGSAAALNILLDVLWIFGYAGFPQMGWEGAAWATVVAHWFKVVVYWWLMYRGDNRVKFRLDASAFDWRLMRRLLRFGIPNGLQLVLEGGAFTFFILVMGQFGETAAAACAIVFSVNMMAFVPMFGVSVAVSTLVGQQIGAGRPALAARATWTAVVMALAYTSVFGILYVVVPDLFLLGHASGTADLADVRALTAVLLRFVAVYCLFDALQLIFVGAIKGAGDMRFVLITTVAMSAGFVIVGSAGARFAIPEGWSMTWWWLVITSWIVLLCVIYFARFVQGRWRQMRVIEADGELADDLSGGEAAELTPG